MSLRLLFITSLLALSCQVTTDDWQTLDFGNFKLKAPKGWKQFKVKGIDAYIGGLTNGKDSLWFYYGQYISGPTDKESIKQLYGQDTINGFSAVITIPRSDSVGKTELFIPHVTESDKFALSGYALKDRETVLKIFKSVTFKNSDTSKNGTLDYRKFKEYPFGSGRTLFYAYCNSCHAINKIIDGPTIEYLVRDRSTEWIHKFLTNRQSVASDSLYQLRVKSYGANCMQFDNLTVQDVEQIIGYIKEH
jgi:cytochrome c